MNIEDRPVAVDIFCGALGQDLSDEKAIKHAAFWTAYPEGDLRGFLATHYPKGFADERKHATAEFRRTNKNREEVFALVDQFVANNGISKQSKMTLIAGISAEFFDGRSAASEIDHMWDRVLYHERRKEAGLLRTLGKGQPVSLAPRHLQGFTTSGDEVG